MILLCALKSLWGQGWWGAGLGGETLWHDPHIQERWDFCSTTSTCVKISTETRVLFCVCLRRNHAYLQSQRVKENDRQGLVTFSFLRGRQVGVSFWSSENRIYTCHYRGPRNDFALNHAEKCKIVSTILKQDRYYKRFPFCLLVSDKYGASLSGLESDISKMHPH